MSEDRRFTPGQQRQLQQLLDAGAVDRESGKAPYDRAMAGFCPVVCSKLWKLGLADSRRVGNSRSGQHTEYWLTPAGVAAARELAAA